MLRGLADSIFRPILGPTPSIPGGFLPPDDDVSQCPGGGFFPPEHWQSSWSESLEQGGIGEALSPELEWDPNDCLNAVGNYAD